ncbi:putative membrane protein [Burkholderia pseudomallei TSV28]|nr:putative membrane protein [Burkholderia pseudomallei TSV28]
MVVAQKQNVSIITEYVLFDTLLVCLLFFYYLP